jgi:adenylate cyclase
MTPRHQAIPPRLLDWLLFDVGNTSDLPHFLDALGKQLCHAGLAVWRITLNIPTLHPEQRAYTFVWTEGQTTATTPRAHGIEQTSAFLASPFRLATESGKPLRRRLDAPQPELPVLEEFREAGGTDYLIVPLSLLLRTAAVSFVTRQAAGFSDAALAALEAVAAAATPHISLRSIRLSAVNLLNTYVGRGAGEHILSGQIRRGDGETIHAAIWYCDLRGFTRASDRLPRDAIIALLNDYFGVMAEAVTAARGEILKFMGDAMLAMFAVPAAAERRAVALAALDAAGAAQKGIAALNQRRAANGDIPVRFGLALHIGEAMFGNIGASARLDFTVIGPAVNYAARLEKLTASLERPVLVSAALAALLPSDALVPVGKHALKDIDEPQAVYAPPEEGKG